jgi:hypothetical protein
VSHERNRHGKKGSNDRSGYSTVYPMDAEQSEKRVSVATMAGILSCDGISRLIWLDVRHGRVFQHSGAVHTETLTSLGRRFMSQGYKEMLH